MTAPTFLERRRRRARTWWCSRFFRQPRPSVPVLGLFCDCEGHHAGPDGERFAEPGLRRLLGLLRERDLRITFNVVADLCQTHPDRVRRIARADHEIACHGWRHERPFDLSDEETNHMLAQARACFADLQIKPVGFRSPQSAWSTTLLRHLPTHGFRWNAERDKAPSPYRIRRDLLRVPVAADDWDLADGTSTAQDLLRKWTRLLQTPNPVVCLGVHEWVVGQHADFPAALSAWLAEVQRSGTRRLKTLGEIAGL